MSDWIRLELGPGVTALWSDRGGGVSEGPAFATANAGRDRGDDPAAVAENRRRIGAALGGRAADPAAWNSLHQVHGARVAVVGTAGRGAGAPPGEVRGRGPGRGGEGARITADAAVTTEPGAVLSVLTADCGPVALAAPGGAGVVHAGWRGVGAGVVEAAVSRLGEIAGGPLRAVIGPCIRPCCYEFGADDLEPLRRRLGPEVAGQTRSGSLALDLPRAIALALERAGVDDVTDLGICTACSAGHFSHRRDGRGGLQALLVGLGE
jgi:purine-nucleoside/S-methyl-5'-thioadenosine phosphorylase / adenosine deaminase